MQLVILIHVFDNMLINFKKLNEILYYEKLEQFFNHKLIPKKYYNSFSIKCINVINIF